MGRTQGKPEARSLGRHPDCVNEEDEDGKDDGSGGSGGGGGIRKMGIGQADGCPRLGEPPQCLDIGAPPPGIEEVVLDEH